MLKNKVAATTTSYESLDLKDALDGISNAGLSYIELMAVRGAHIKPEEMGSIEVESLRKQLKDRNLKLVTISGHTDLTKVENVPPC